MATYLLLAHTDPVITTNREPDYKTKTSTVIKLNHHHHHHQMGFPTQYFPFPGRPGPLSNEMLLGTTRVSLPNGISFRPTALTGRMSVTGDTHADGQRTGR